MPRHTDFSNCAGMRFSSSVSVCTTRYFCKEKYLIDSTKYAQSCEVKSH
jgi:hypothetical protein